MKKSLKRKIKYVLISIFILPILLVVVFFLLGYSLLAYDYIFYHTDSIPKARNVKLDNGFIYANREHLERGKVYKRRFILDKDNKFITDDGIDGLITVGNIIYGRRDKFLANTEYDYFFCEYGTDCSKTKNLEKEELDKILKDKGLPKLKEGNMETYKSLLTKEWLKRIFTFQWNNWDE